MEFDEIASKVDEIIKAANHLLHTRIHVLGKDESLAPSVSLTTRSETSQARRIIRRLYQVLKCHR